ncbi:inner membrane protein YiaA [Sneathiella glossodoripedis]|uniref:inner membrane protein YiaA n=1 Tax=Sneathiella glossodoripedis TaxID=418853 RepID=UPI00046EC2CF|nr:inner membrane protein YiaA [Sneathiella glossodoripedis]
MNVISKPSSAFVGASWAALGVGVIAYLLGLYNAPLQLNEKGYYLICLMFGLYSAVSLQKTVRDKAEGIPVTGVYYNLSWVALGSSVVLLLIGLWNAEMQLNEKGFFLMGFTLSLFAAIAVQKNTRDLLAFSLAAPVSEESEFDHLYEEQGATTSNIEEK